MDKPTPPVTPPLSIASPNGDIGRGSRFNSNRSPSSSGSRRKRPRSRTLGHLYGNLADAYERGDGSGGGGDDDIDAERHRGSHPASSSATSRFHRREASYFALYESNDDDSVHGGTSGKQQHQLPPSTSRFSMNLPKRAGKKHPSANEDGRGCCKRRRRRCLSRCMLVFVVCLAIAHWSFKIVWWFLWQARCTEGCYDADAGKTGSLGPEQVAF